MFGLFCELGSFVARNVFRLFGGFVAMRNVTLGPEWDCKVEGNKQNSPDLCSDTTLMREVRNSSN